MTYIDLSENIEAHPSNYPTALCMGTGLDTPEESIDEHCCCVADSLHRFARDDALWQVGRCIWNIISVLSNYLHLLRCENVAVKLFQQHKAERDRESPRALAQRGGGNGYRQATPDKEPIPLGVTIHVFRRVKKSMPGPTHGGGKSVQSSQKR